MQKRTSKLTIQWLAAVAVACVAFAQMPVSAAEPALKWFDCKDIGIEGRGWNDTKAVYDRLPAKAEGKAPASVWGLSHNSAGLCVRFTTDASAVQVRWVGGNSAMHHMPATGVSGVDLYQKHADGKWFFVGVGQPVGVTNTAAFGVQPNEPCLLYLPLYSGVKSVEIGVPAGKTVKAAKLEGKKPIVFYGTSIDQGGCASRPGMAFISIIGRKLDMPMINLGFSGSGKMEPAMADLMAELDPSVFVLDCLWNMTPDLVATRTEPLVKKFRAAHPDTPILLVEDYNFRNQSPTANGKPLRKAFENLKADGVKNLHFLSAENMLGTDGEGTVDGCHPNDLGMMRLADAFVKALKPILEESAK